MTSEFDRKYRARLEKLSTTNVADALDALGFKGATYGVRPIWEGAGKIVGRAVTVKLISAGLTAGGTHLGIRAIEAADPGDIVVIDNGGRIDTSCWGGILATGASLKGISGVVADGAVRDVDDYVALGFAVYARGAVTATARGRIMEESTNALIEFGGVQVRPGDVVIADRSGVVIVPWEKVAEVITKAESLFEKEEAMIADLKAGLSSGEVDAKYSYEKMLKS
jgi:regulator of RNase E activity RraA